ncbi:MAG: hypothetical protein LBF05_01735, partial [Tannerella sp.]|nr:hypothetical protein [Tannerella sp.]
RDRRFDLFIPADPYQFGLDHEDRTNLGVDSAGRNKSYINSKYVDQYSYLPYYFGSMLTPERNNGPHSRMACFAQGYYFFVKH